MQYPMTLPKSSASSASSKPSTSRSTSTAKTSASSSSSYKPSSSHRQPTSADRSRKQNTSSTTSRDGSHKDKPPSTSSSTDMNAPFYDYTHNILLTHACPLHKEPHPYVCFPCNQQMQANKVLPSDYSSYLNFSKSPLPFPLLCTLLPRPIFLNPFSHTRIGSKQYMRIAPVILTTRHSIQEHGLTSTDYRLDVWNSKGMHLGIHTKSECVASRGGWEAKVKRRLRKGVWRGPWGAEGWGGSGREWETRDWKVVLGDLEDEEWERKVCWGEEEEMRGRRQGWVKDEGRQKAYDEGSKVPAEDGEVSPFALALKVLQERNSQGSSEEPPLSPKSLSVRQWAWVYAEEIGDPREAFVPSTYSDYSSDDNYDSGDDGNSRPESLHTSYSSSHLIDRQTPASPRLAVPARVEARGIARRAPPIRKPSFTSSDSEDEDAHPTKETILRSLNKEELEQMGLCEPTVANVGSGRRKGMSVLFTMLLNDVRAPVGERIERGGEWERCLREQEE